MLGKGQSEVERGGIEDNCVPVWSFTAARKPLGTRLLGTGDYR